MNSYKVTHADIDREFHVIGVESSWEARKQIAEQMNRPAAEFMAVPAQFVTCTIPFSGFYESSHDGALDSALEQMFSDDSGDTDESILSDAMDSVDWRIVHLAYAQSYCSALADECNAKWEFVKMDSPREYNFRSDEIDVTIETAELWRIYNETDKQSLAVLIKKRLAPRSGFIPYYCNDVSQWGALDTWEAPQIGLLIESYCNEHCDIDARNWDLVDDCNGAITAMLESAMPADKLHSLYERADATKESAI